VLGVGQKIMVEITKMDDKGKLSLAPVVEGDGDSESSAASSEGPGDAPAEG
jgi:polyribonucleotide nucleotidyltransferase